MLQTSLGTSWFSVLPLPSWPYFPLPHVYTWPSAANAAEWLSPQEIWTIPRHLRAGISVRVASRDFCTWPAIPWSVRKQTKVVFLQFSLNETLSVMAMAKSELHAHICHLAVRRHCCPLREQLQLMWGPECDYLLQPLLRTACLFPSWSVADVWHLRLPLPALQAFPHHHHECHWLNSWRLCFTAGLQPYRVVKMKLLA